ncbi:INO80 complex subunit D [Spatholobus suberectus]|nr:INO80 complex subunit D [Spatholobus suberectus]
MDEAEPFSNTTVSSACHLTRPELLKRRFQNLKRLSKCYRELYWALMEHLKSLYSHYGLNPFKQIGHLSAQAGPITCGKPILRSTVPALCTVHSQKAQKHLTRTLKRNSPNISSTSKMAPKFHVLLTEYVNQIQVRRRKEPRGNKSKIVVQKENDG